MKKGFISVMLVILLVLSVLVGCGQGVGSAKEERVDTLQRIVEDGKMVVGVRARFPPIGQVNSTTGEIEGFVIDLIKLYAEKLDVKMEMKNVEWAALIPGLLNKDFDILACHMTRTVPRTASIALSDPFILTGTVAVLNANSRLSKWDDLNSSNVKIGITEGNVYIDIIEQRFPKAEMLTFAGKSEWTEALKAGRIDCILDGEFAGLDMMDIYPGSFKILPDGYLDIETYGFATRYEDLAFINSMNIFLQEIKASGEFGRIYEKWIGKEWVPTLEANAI
ncbi:MAG: substrate-binding periplasmic protein [Sphaerochaetaceae bacterium]|jgi:ABC-type amino acid transport substrate-binding protein